MYSVEIKSPFFFSLSDTGPSAAQECTIFFLYTGNETQTRAESCARLSAWFQRGNGAWGLSLSQQQFLEAYAQKETYIYTDGTSV